MRKKIKSKKFKSLVKEYFDAVIKRFPEYGSFLGLQKYDGKWSKEDIKTYLENTKFYKRYLNKFIKINLKRLSEKDKLDKEIIIQNLKLIIFYLEELHLWESDPDIAEGIGVTLFLLLNRQDISNDEKIKKINKYLKGAPPLFEQIKTRITKPYRLWVEIAIDSCEGLLSFLENLKLIKIRKSFKKEFLQNIKLSLKAVEDYRYFLKKDILLISINKHIIGENKFRRLIKLRELGLNIKEMLEIGERALSVNKKELKEIAREINPRLTVKEVEKKIEKKHSDNFKEIIKQYRRITAKARNFILTHNLIEIPKDEKIIIKETPSFLIHTTPFAAYFSPPKFVKKKVGIYIITPAKQKRLLERHNYTSIFNTSVHEAYPGHHLQFVLGFKNPSLVRILSGATEMIEGWAHYCEEYMRDVGFNNTAETRFVQTQDEIWRAARIIIDINLHFGKMSFNEAVRFLMKKVGMEKENAIAEVKRYTKSPGYQLSYLIGKHLIKRLKRDIQEKMGEKYSDRFFHEVILNAGSVPIKYLKEEFNLKINK